MSLRLKDGSLLLDGPGGSLADDADCCTCECYCETRKADGNPCNCLTEAYGTVQLVKSLEVIISGSMSSLGYSSLPCADTGCPSINGTYVLPCLTGKRYQIEHFICNYDLAGFGVFRDYYQSIYFEITWAPNAIDGWKAQINIFSFLSSRPTGEAYYSTVTEVDGRPFALFNITRASRTVVYVDPNVLYEDWVYVPGGDCTEDCNIVIYRQGCPSFSTSPVDDSLIGTEDGCDVSTLGIAVSLI